jgi:hypothetical protein
MAIVVVCPGCHKRFTVSDQFAGRSGACPNCKADIRVPTKDEEIKVHDPSQFGPGVRGATPHPSVKPIARSETKWSPVVAGGICGAVLAVLLVTWAAGRAGLFTESWLMPALGLLLVSPPLVIAGYFFLHDQEDLAPYRGKVLYIRTAICSLTYMALWGVYGIVVDQGLVGEIWSWLYMAPLFLVAGGFAAWACLDLEFGSGFFHYCFYLLVTVLLRGLADMGWVWDVPKPLTP